MSLNEVEEIVPAVQAPQSSTPSSQIRETATSSSLAEQFAVIEEAVERMVNSSGLERNTEVPQNHVQEASLEFSASKPPFVFGQSIPEVSRANLTEVSAPSEEVSPEFAASKVPIVFEQCLSSNQAKFSENTAPIGDAVDRFEQHIPGSSQADFSESSALVKEASILEMYEVREPIENMGSNII